MQRNRLLGQLAMAFGGRVAEEIFCGDISAGAADDIRRATELARAMVTELGMSEKVGPIHYAEREGSDFLGTELLSGKWHSEVTARQIDEEVERILREALEKAREIVSREKSAVERLTAALLAYETINAEEIASLVAGSTIEDLRRHRSERAAAERPRERAPGIEARAPSGDTLCGDLPGEPELSPA
jgi:cell division protease FtsH